MIKQLFLLLTTCIFLNSCNSGTPSKDTDSKEWMSSNDRVKVLSTIAMIDDLVQKIGNGYIDHQTLIKGELDPHSYQLVKGDDEKLAFANLIFYNGLGLEHGPSLQHYLQRNNKGVAVGDQIGKNHPELILKVNGQTDPHIWMDISLWAQAVPVIVKALSEQDPSHAEIYEKNGKDLIAELDQAHKDVRETLHQIPAEKRFLVTSHDAFNYFTRAYLAADGENNMNEWEKRFAAPEGLAPESQLSTTDIKNIIDHMRTYQVTVLFPESNVSKDSIKKIVDAGKKQGLDLRIATVPLYADAMGKPGSEGDTYIKMIKHDATTITEYLK